MSYNEKELIPQKRQTTFYNFLFQIMHQIAENCMRILDENITLEAHINQLCPKNRL